MSADCHHIDGIIYHRCCPLVDFCTAPPKLHYARLSLERFNRAPLYSVLKNFSRAAIQITCRGSISPRIFTPDFAIIENTG